MNQNYFTTFSPTLPTYDSPQQREVKLLIDPWDSYLKNSKDDKIVYNYFIGKLKVLLIHGFPRPSVSTKSKLVFGTLGEEKIPLISLTAN